MFLKKIGKMFSLFMESKIFLLGVILSALSVYAVLWGIYLNNDIDNSWSTAWIYNFVKHGNMRDVVFCEGDDSYWGVRFFSHIFCWIYGGIASVIGFDRNTMQGISIALMGVGFFFWHKASINILDDRRCRIAFMILLVFSGVAVAAAMKIRTDALVFALTAFSFFLMTKSQWFWSIFAACLAVETHPIGITAFCYLLAYLIVYKREVFDLKHPRSLLLMFLGGFAGVMLYIGLHFSELSGLGAMFKNAADKHNFLYMHFFGRSSYSWRYFPEFLLFVIAFIAHFFVFRRRKNFFPYAVLFLVAASFLIRRGNFHYALFAYPAFLLLTVNLMNKMGRVGLNLLVAGWLFLMIPQFVYLAIRNNPGRDYNDYIMTLRKLEIPSGSTIYGMPSDYFAFFEYPGFRHLPLCKKDKAAYIIQHCNTIYSQPGVSCDLNYDAKCWSLNKISEFHPRSGGVVTVWKVGPNI